jgi:predicted ATPase
MLQGHHCQWATLYMLGAHDECCKHIEHGLKLYNREHHHAHAALYGGHDARVCALGERALARWMLGRPREALEDAQAALGWANELRHVGSRAHAMDYVLVLHKFRRDAASVAACASELVAFSAEQHLRDHHAKGAFFRGWAHAMMDDLSAGISEMREAMAAFEGVGTPEDVSVYYEMLAEAFAKAGRYDDGLRAVEDALRRRHAAESAFGVRSCIAAMANCCSQRPHGKDAAVASSFENALACARDQRALTLELRAALSFARWRLKVGDAHAATEILRTVL